MRLGNPQGKIWSFRAGNIETMGKIMGKIMGKYGQLLENY